MDYFKYVPPNDRTLPIYQQIRLAQSSSEECFREVVAALVARGTSRSGDRASAWKKIADISRSFYDVVMLNCPESGDREDAVRNIRIAKMYANEVVKNSNIQACSYDTLLLDEACKHLLLARFFANASVALNDEIDCVDEEE